MSKVEEKERVWKNKKA